MKILIVIPVYNEEKIIDSNLRQLLSFCQRNFNPADFLILVADNASTDKTRQITTNLAQESSQIEYLFIPQKGKGLAIATAWQTHVSLFDYFVFMDADLATDLSAVPELLQALGQGADLAIGSRYLPQSRVVRSRLRRLFSFSYRNFLALFLQTKIKDFPCGFKAVTQKVVQDIVPQIKNQTWFFDTELVYLAEQAGLKIKEIPVTWAEPQGRESRVRLAKVSWQYLREVWRLKWQK